MSKENVEHIIALCHNDEAVAWRLQDGDAQHFEALTMELGYPCSMQELKAVAQDKIASGELTPEQLNAVVGGSKLAQSDTLDTMLALLTALKTTQGIISS